MKNLGRLAAKVRRSPRARDWAFPALLCVIVVFLSALKISGSSIGYYQTTLNGWSIPNHNRIYGHAESVRSDEWLVSTPMTISQYHNDFRRINPDIGTGQDMSVIFDVPYRDWSTLFRPQDLPFFVLPFEVAFALKWWLLGLGVVIPLYFLILRWLPERRALTGLVALGFVWSPFMQWWYQSITLAPVAFSLMALLVLLDLRRRRSWRQTLWRSALLAYLLVCFALVLYPPFQIPCLMVAAVLYLGATLEDGGLGWRRLLRLAIPIAGAGLVAGGLLLAFILTRHAVIQTVENTVYPGHRVVVSGGFEPSRFLSGFISTQLQHGRDAAHYYTNQSEGSTFIFLWPYLLIPSAFAIAYKYRRERKVLWQLLGVNLLLLFFSTHLFIHLPAWLTKDLGFSGILQSRLLLGFGLLGIFQLVLVIRAGAKSYPRWLPIIMGVAAIWIQIVAGLHTKTQNPGYITSNLEIVGLAVVVGVIVWLILRGRAVAGAALLLLLSLFSIFHIHPLYRGLGPLLDSPITQAIRHQEAVLPGKWIVLNSIPFDTITQQAGVPSYSGVYSYPQLNIWKQYDPTGAYADIYNRYALAVYTMDPEPAPFTLDGGDTFFVSYNPCSRVGPVIKHVLSLQPISSDCLQLDQAVIYPQQTFYLYHTR